MGSIWVAEQAPGLSSSPARMQGEPAPRFAVGERREEDTMHRFIIAALALGLCGIAAAEGNDDPYLWLEEIQGEKALDWANKRSAQDTATSRRCRSSTRSTAPFWRSTTPVIASRTRDPRRLDLQLLARRRARARNLAPHLPRRVRQGRPRLGDRARSRRAGRSRRRELGVEGRELPGAGLPALHDHPVARRQRRRCAARVRHRRQRHSSQTASSCRRPSRTSAGRTRTQSGSAPISVRAR